MVVSIVVGGGIFLFFVVTPGKLAKLFHSSNVYFFIFC
jgi:hypothetical protein